MYSGGEPYCACGTNNAMVVYDGLWSRTGHTPAKYDRPFDPNRFPNNLSTNNLRLIRLADVLLLLAEAKLLGNGDVAGDAALSNQVGARARQACTILNGTAPPPTVLPDVP